MRNPINYRIRRLSEQGRRAARARWDREALRLTKLDELDPVRVGGKIVRRVIVIDGETRIKERTFYQFDRPCDWRRKLREVLR